MKQNISGLPIESITYIAFFLKPLPLILLNKKLSIDISTNGQYWKEITERDFGWVLKQKSTPSEEKNYLQLYKILTHYERLFKNKDNKNPLSPSRLLPQLQQITQTVDAKFIPSWLNGQMFLESVIINQALAINLFQLVMQYYQLSKGTSDHSIKTRYQKKASHFAVMALETGFEQKHKTTKVMTCQILSNLNSIPSGQLLSLLEKNYQYTYIYSNAGKFNLDVEHLPPAWWEQMVNTSHPGEKLQQIDGLLELYLYYDNHSIPMPGISSVQLKENIDILSHMKKTTTPKPSAIPGQRKSLHEKTNTPTGCLMC